MFGGTGRYVRRMARKGVKKLKKRYTAKPGGRKFTSGVRVGKMAKDIMYLKSVLNPEKKRFEVNTSEGVPIGQVNGNTDGGYLFDATPTPTQGVTYNTRNGASIKLHSSMYHFQFTQQTNASSDIKVIIEFYAVKGDSYTGFNFRTERFLPNPFTNGDIRDFNSQTNPDNFMKAVCIGRRKLTIKADQIAGQRNVTDVKMPLLYNRGKGHHVRYNRDTQTVEHGQIYLMIRVDRGNIGAVSTLQVPDVGVSSGLSMLWNKCDYYYDN